MVSIKKPKKVPYLVLCGHREISSYACPFLTCYCLISFILLYVERIICICGAIINFAPFPLSHKICNFLN